MEIDLSRTNHWLGSPLPFGLFFLAGDQMFTQIASGSLVGIPVPHFNYRSFPRTYPENAVIIVSRVEEGKRLIPLLKAEPELVLMIEADIKHIHEWAQLCTKFRNPVILCAPPIPLIDTDDYLLFHITYFTKRLAGIPAQGICLTVDIDALSEAVLLGREALNQMKIARF